MVECCCQSCIFYWTVPVDAVSRQRSCSCDGLDSSVATFPPEFLSHWSTREWLEWISTSTGGVWLVDTSTISIRSVAGPGGVGSESVEDDCLMYLVNLAREDRDRDRCWFSLCARRETRLFWHLMSDEKWRWPCFLWQRQKKILPVIRQPQPKARPRYPISLGIGKSDRGSCGSSGDARGMSVDIWSVVVSGNVGNIGLLWDSTVSAVSA